MNLFVCEHPKRVVNPYTGEELLVPCGECNSCVCRHSLDWVERLEIERMCHPYTVFFTLTYSEEFCPKVFFDTEAFECVDNVDGEVLTFDELGLFRQDFETKKSRKYIEKRKWLSFPYVPHLQKFIKRLRSKIYENEPNELKKKLRYYIVSEYGSTNHRVHYHGLLFFESTWFAENIEECISSAWSTDNRNKDVVSFGRTDCDFVQSSAASYCAQYLNCYDKLPTIFKVGKFRNIQIMSRHNPIGSLLIKSKEIQEVFIKCLTTMRLYSRKQQRFNDVPLPKSIENRLFPRIKGFDMFSHSIRVTLYGYLYSTKSFVYDFETFLDSLNCVTSQQYGDDVASILKSYSYEENLSACHRFYSLLNRCDSLRYDYGLSVEDLVSKIELYYQKKDYSNLVKQMEFEESYDGNVSDLLFLDSLFHHRLLWKSELKDTDLLILKSYGWNEEEMSAYDFLYSLDYSKHNDFINLVSRSKSIFDHSIKNKKKKEYIRAELHTDDF